MVYQIFLITLGNELGFYILLLVRPEARVLVMFLQMIILGMRIGLQIQDYNFRCYQKLPDLAHENLVTWVK